MTRSTNTGAQTSQERDSERIVIQLPDNLSPAQRSNILAVLERLTKRYGVQVTTGRT